MRGGGRRNQAALRIARSGVRKYEGRSAHYPKQVATRLDHLRSGWALCRAFPLLVQYRRRKKEGGRFG